LPQHCESPLAKATNGSPPAQNDLAAEHGQTPTNSEQPQVIGSLELRSDRSLVDDMVQAQQRLLPAALLDAWVDALRDFTKHNLSAGPGSWKSRARAPRVLA